MPSTSLTFADRAAHRAWLASQAALPAGFRVGTASLDFVPVEVPKPARMDVTLIATPFRGRPWWWGGAGWTAPRSARSW